MYNNPTRLLVLCKTEIRRKRGNGVKKVENVYVVLTAPAITVSFKSHKFRSCNLKVMAIDRKLILQVPNDDCCGTGLVVPKSQNFERTFQKHFIFSLTF
jgi:hypothetical protein